MLSGTDLVAFAYCQRPNTYKSDRTDARLTKIRLEESKGSWSSDFTYFHLVISDMER